MIRRASRIWAIALNTFREAKRSKVLYGVVGVVLIGNLVGVLVGSMSLHEEARIARDIGLAGVSLFGAATAIALGVSLLYAEIHKRTIHAILAKPLERHEFVLGKYLGMVIVLTLLVALFAVALAGVLWLSGMSFDGNVAKAVVLGYQEVLLVAAIAAFFSSFSTPYLSGLFTFAIFFLGRVSPELHYAAERAKQDWIRPIARVALYIVPDLHLFSVSGGSVDGKAVSVNAAFVTWHYVGMAGLYAAALIAVLLGLAAAIFRRRDFV